MGLGGKMKRIILFIGALLFSASNFAMPTANLNQSLKNLGSTLKQQSSTPQPLDKNDMIMGYGGADISHKPTIPHIAVA